MLTDFEVRTGQGAIMPFPLDSFETGFSVQDIAGLDPVPAEITSTGYATQDGEQYQAARRGKRNIVLKLGLEVDFANQSARQLRNLLYGFFMPKSEVDLRFIHDEEADVSISGRVEDFKCPLFVQKPVATISIINFESDFVDPSPVRITGNSTETLTENQKDYDGTVEAGFIFKLNINRALTQFSIKNTPEDGKTRSMDIAAELIAGDVVEVSTVPGNKYIVLIRQGLRVSYLYALSPFSDWLQLFPGTNRLRVAASGAAIPYTIDYYNRYGGL